MYVVMPVRATVRTAIKVAAQPPTWIQQNPAAQSAQDQPTPRLREIGARVLPAADEPDVVRFADNNGIIVEVRVAP